MQPNIFVDKWHVFSNVNTHTYVLYVYIYLEEKKTSQCLCYNVIHLASRVPCMHIFPPTFTQHSKQQTHHNAFIVESWNYCLSRFITVRWSSVEPSESLIAFYHSSNVAQLSLLIGSTHIMAARAAHFFFTSYPRPL